jgi:hypothetical protein
METIKHVASGKEYEIRVISAEVGFEIRTYRLGTQIGRSYTAPYETAHHFNETATHFTGTRALSQLVECAKSDIDLATRN